MSPSATATGVGAIAGIGLTAQARSLDTTSVEACLDASRLALTDAGMTLDDIDGVAARWPGPGGTVFQPGSVDWTALFGRPLRWVCDTYPQGVPGVLDAAAAVSAGLCENVLVVGGQAGILGGESVASYTRPDNEFIACWGALTAAHFALVGQVYLHRHQPDPHRLASVAATIRNAGSANPDAVMAGRGPYTAEDVLASPLVADPFRRLDLCLATEGAAAVIVTSVERARDCPKPGAVILGGGAEWHRQQYVDPARYDEVWTIGADAYARTLGRSGLTASDIDVFELYDVTTLEVVRQFETLGLCGEGEGVDYLAESGIGVDQRHPTNTDGGLLSFSHIGWGGPQLKVVEAVRQLRGEAGPGQVDGAETVFVTGAGSGAQYHNAMVLAVDR